jgi:hypothetical protein
VPTSAAASKPPLIRFGRQSVYFFPDAAFVIDGKQVGAISYDNISIQGEGFSFIEEETVPADAKVIRQTWKYLNKSGGPDRRFSNNYQIPVCRYELAQFSSSSGLNELLEFSRTGVLEPFANAIRNLSLRMGGPATSKQLQYLQLFKKAHQMFLDTKADFFRRFKDASNLSDDLVQFREKIVSGENFNNLILAVLCTIAGADGPINMKEAEVINLLLGVQKNDLVYNEFLKSIRDTNVSITFEAIVDVAMQLGGIEQGKNYEPQNDPMAENAALRHQVVVCRVHCVYRKPHPATISVFASKSLFLRQTSLFLRNNSLFYIA